jgi:hypothetical protein
MSSSRRIAIIGTAFVIAYEATLFVHGTAHARLGIGVSAAQSVYIWAVMLIGPPIAMVLLWTSQQRTGLSLLALSTAAGFPFDLYFHFIAAGSDNALQQPSGEWPAMFVTTAILLQLLTAAGVLVGVWYLRAPAQPSD